jgi:RNA polymerase sigma-70 factor (ECF subfamily)
MLRAGHKSRVDYVGAWLPEPIHTPIEDDIQRKLDLSSTLTTAFLLMLERLTPKERAAYLLHDIFDVPYREIAKTLEINEAACRKLVSRAKASIDRAKVRHTTPIDRQDRLLAAFQAAIADGETDPLAALLSEDIRLSADGGGKVPAVLDVLHGKPAVIGFLRDRLREFWSDYQWLTTDINGGRGIILRRNGVTEGTVSFAYDETGRATDIFIVRNPDKLGHLDAVAIH